MTRCETCESVGCTSDLLDQASDLLIDGWRMAAEWRDETGVLDVAQQVGHLLERAEAYGCGHEPTSSRIETLRQHAKDLLAFVSDR